MAIKYEFLDSSIDNGFEKWYDHNEFLIRDGSIYFEYNLEGKMTIQRWSELGNTREVHEVLYEIRHEYSKKKDSFLKYKIGTISFDESSQASYENRKPLINTDSELLNIREEIYNDERRLVHIKDFDITNSTIKETFLYYHEELFESYKSFFNGILIEEKTHYQEDGNLIKIRQSFSPIDKLEPKKIIDFFFDENGFETRRNYQFEMSGQMFETKIDFEYNDDQTIVVLSEVVPFHFSCSEILRLPSEYYYPNLDDHAQKTNNFKIVVNYNSGNISSLYLYNNNDQSLLEFSSFIEKVIYNHLTFDQSHRIITGVRFFENTIENTFTHVKFY